MPFLNLLKVQKELAIFIAMVVVDVNIVLTKISILVQVVVRVNYVRMEISGMEVSEKNVVLTVFGVASGMETVFQIFSVSR